MSLLLEGALRYASYGWPIFPCEERGKKPLTSHGFQDATTNERKIRKWWRTTPNANIGAPTGHAFIALDADNADAIEWGKSQGLGEPTSKTGRGVQWFFRTPSFKVRNSAGKFYPGVDVRGHGGYVILPPSIHPSGKRYEWARCKLLEIPPWLEELLNPPVKIHAPSKPREFRGKATAYAQTALAYEVLAVREASKGTRNDRLVSACFSIGQLVGSGSLSEHDALEELEYAARSCSLPEKEIARTVSRLIKRGMKHPRK